MDKTYQTELHRKFLLKSLPEPLMKSSKHLQIYENYLENTRLCLKKMRLPETKVWSFVLRQMFPIAQKKGVWKTAEIHLNDDEYFEFRIFEGREIRKNRYFFELDRKIIEIDSFLGELTGLLIAKVVFENEKEFEEFEIPPFVISEITENPFFYGENLVNKDFSQVQEEVRRLNETSQIFLNKPDE